MRSSFWGPVAAALAAVLFGASVAVTRFVVVQTDPLTLALLRYVIASAIIMPLVWALHGLRLPLRALLPIAALGVLFFAAFPYLFSAALQYTFASRGALLIGTSPVLTMSLGILLGQERYSHRRALGVALTLGGLALALGEKLAQASGPAGVWRGDLLMVGALLCGVTFMLASRRYIRAYNALRVSAYAMLAGVLALALVSGVTGGLLPELRFSAEGWAAVAFLGILGGALGFYLAIWALGRITATQSAVCLSLNPTTATMLGALWLGEPLGPGFAAGFAVLLVGIVLTNWPVREPAEGLAAAT